MKANFRKDLSNVASMSARHLSRFILLVILLFGIALPAAADTPAQDRANIRKQSSQILSGLYKAKPNTRNVVKHGVGYATFSNFGMKILLAGGGSGHGIVVDNATKRETFMKMVEVQAGLGFGIKKFRVIFVFDTREAMNDFINQGWEFGGQGTAAAAIEGEGAQHSDAVSVSPGVWMYQMTDTGVAMELTGKGTKYFKDDDLNAK